MVSPCTSMVPWLHQLLTCGVPMNFSIGNGRMVLGRRETNVDKLYASFLMDELTLWTEEFSAEDVKDLYDAY